VAKKATSKNIINSLGRKSLAPVTHWLSTGSTLLNLAISDRPGGGFPAGRISQVYGPNSTAKTVLAIEPLGSAQRQGGRAFFEDAEFTFDENRARSLFGVDVDSPEWSYRNPTSIEELFDANISKAIETIGKKTDHPHFMSVDSLSSLPSAAEIGKDLEDTGYGTSRAKQFSTAFRKYIWPLNAANLGVLFVDQSRINISGYGEKLVTSGGEALKFYASVRVKVTLAKKLINRNKIVEGVQIHFQVVKNKVASPFREGDFRFIFDYGIDDIGSNLEWLKEDEGGWYKFGELKAQGLDKMVRLIEKEEKEAELVEAVEDKWRELYPPSDRKPKKRET